MLERLLWLVALAALAAGVKWLIKRSVRNISPSGPTDHHLLYFWGPHCTACAAVRQTLAIVMRDAPWIKLRDINAIQHPDEAKNWGVMTIPAIILLDRTGQIAYRASGSISAGQLRDAITTHQAVLKGGLHE